VRNTVRNTGRGTPKKRKMRTGGVCLQAVNEEKTGRNEDKQINPPLSLRGKETTQRGKVSAQATEILETEWPGVETERQRRQAEKIQTRPALGHRRRTRVKWTQAEGSENQLEKDSKYNDTKNNRILKSLRSRTSSSRKNEEHTWDPKSNLSIENHTKFLHMRRSPFSLPHLIRMKKILDTLLL
jgi:hypothetical protein